MAGVVIVDSAHVEDSNQCGDNENTNYPDEVFRQSHENEKGLEKGMDQAGVKVLDNFIVRVTKPIESNVDTMEPDAITKDLEKGVKKTLKRKRVSVDENLISRDKGSLVSECRRELDDLFESYKEVSAHKLHLEDSMRSFNNSVVACLLEESNLSYSKLVEEIYETLKARKGVTLASVRSFVLSVGQRVMYGVPNPDVDVLEDESESCLWCWETRDMKWLPMSQRGTLNFRRMARKRIHERISAVSELLSALSNPEGDENYKSDLMKASLKHGKALNFEGIRSLIEELKQKNDVGVSAAKEAKVKKKESLKEMEKSKRSAEKEKKRMDCELHKEQCRKEKELKRLQEETKKEERRREKEEAELKKQLKEQRAAERDKQRSEKKAAELKEQLAIRKQATIMERFLTIKKNNNNLDKQDHGSSSRGPMSSSSCKNEVVFNTTTSLTEQDSLATEDLHKSHVARWHKLSRCNRSYHWGVRRNPKVELIKELKLRHSYSEGKPLQNVITRNKGLATTQLNHDTNQTHETLVDGLEESFTSSQNNLNSVSPPIWPNKKLLQFDKSHRPAYYGTWSKKSGLVGPRQPFKKDRDLDYDVDSDEEWEEEDPGESLSDCDEDNEEESSRIEDEDESEDSFIVSDSYISETEGVQADGSSDGIDDEARSSPSFNPEVVSAEVKQSLQYQKYLHDVTEQTLRKGQPLVISNLMHEKTELITAEDLSGEPKLEQICLQALCMRACPGSSVIDISMNHNPSYEDQEICQSESRTNTTPTSSAVPIVDSDLPEFVRLIRSNPNGINKIVDLLQNRFQNTPKSQLRNKVREISEFVHNRWQVKKEILDMLGLSASPDKGCGSPKGIAMYFSK